MASSLLQEARQRAEQAGLNLFGLVRAERFDACQPCDRRVQQLRAGCGTVVVLGTGGRQFWQRFQAQAGRPGVAAETGESPAVTADRFARRLAHDLGHWLAAQGVTGSVVEPGPRTPVRFSCLGESAGLGVVSPVTGHLLHPEFGPWIALRALLLLDGEPFGPIGNASIAHRFQPCCGCSRPCVTACAPRVYDGNGHQDLLRCASHRNAGNCDTGCNTKIACPVGAEHRDGPDEHAHRHTQPLPQLRRMVGLGLWRFVPRSWRV